MNRLIILFIILLFSTCSVTKQQSSIIGQFKGHTPTMTSFVPSSKMILSLKSDGTFELYWLHVDYTGKWDVLSKKHLVLKFDKITDDSILLSSGIILDKERKIKFINRNKIDFFGYCILKREK